MARNLKRSRAMPMIPVLVASVAVGIFFATLRMEG